MLTLQAKRALSMTLSGVSPCLKKVAESQVCSTSSIGESIGKCKCYDATIMHVV